MTNKKTLVACAAFLLGILLMSSGIASAKPSDEADAVRVENYLNTMGGLEADFSQTDDRGYYRHGKLKLKRPGKMHVAYDAPSKDFIVADGHFINIWDGELEQQTSVPISSSLADLLLRDDIKLSGDITVNKIEHSPARMAVTILSTKEPNAGKLTLVFEDKPLVLRGWEIIDPQGKTTTVSLENTNQHATFESGTFVFVPPNLGKNMRSGK